MQITLGLWTGCHQMANAIHLRQTRTYIYPVQKRTCIYQSILILLLIKYKPPTLKHRSRRWLQENKLAGKTRSKHVEFVSSTCSIHSWSRGDETWMQKLSFDQGHTYTFCFLCPGFGLVSCYICGQRPSIFEQLKLHIPLTLLGSPDKIMWQFI